MNREGGDLMASGQDTTFISNEKETRTRLMAELQVVKALIDNNEAYFNFVSDPDLTEYAVYEKRALQARFSYLIKAIKLIDSGVFNASEREHETAAT